MDYMSHSMVGKLSLELPREFGDHYVCLEPTVLHAFLEFLYHADLVNSKPDRTKQS